MAVLVLARPAISAPADIATVDADQATVDGVLKASQIQGYAATAEKLTALGAIVARAPSPFQATERDGDKAYVRAVSLESCLLVSAEAAQAMKRMPNAPKSVSCLRNPYAQAAFLLGAYWDEQKRFDEGLGWLDRAVALDPDYGPGRVERGLALNQLRRFDEALANDREALSGTASLDPVIKGALQRSEGFALTELGRLAEAETAYRESLKTDPHHGHAQQELAYIARLRSGAPKTDMEITSGLNPAPH